MNKVYFRFIQFSLGLYGGEEFLSGEALHGFDWKAFYSFCKKQTLIGVVFDGIQKLPKELAPNQDLLMTWLGQSLSIRKKNILLNAATAQIYGKVMGEGLRCCILKGQGNATLYPHPHSRTPGDVDVWVNAGRDETRRLACSLAKDSGAVCKESLNHIELAVNGVVVELHSTPAVMNNPLYNCRLQKWLRRNADLQCSNIVSLPDEAGEVAIPTCAFNVVYQLFHLYHHYFYEGIGMRQMIDYHFNMERLKYGNVERLKYGNNGNHGKIERLKYGKIERLQKGLKYLGLWKFAGAVMYVLHETLGLSEDKMICPMDEKRGQTLLDEIVQGGNFGQYDERHCFGHDSIGHNLQRLQRDWRLARHYPAEALSEPIFRTWHFFWRLWRK